MSIRLWMLVSLFIVGCGLLQEPTSEHVYTARASCRTIAKAVNAFKVQFGAPPSQLSELLAPPDGGKRFLEFDEDLIDPWGKPYQMEANPSNVEIEIYTITPKGQRVSSIKSKNE